MPTEQIDFLTPVARTTDPDTSHQAAKRIEPKRGTQASQILAVYRAYPRGLTANEVEDYTKIRGSWKRVSDLLNAGFLRPTGEERDGSRVLVAVED